MKKIIILIFAICLAQISSAQTTTKTEISYKVRAGTIQLYYGDLKISFARAKEMSLDNGFNKSFDEFKKAKKIRNWDIVWYSLGTVNVIQGAATGNLLTLASGAAMYCIPLFPSRGKRFVLYTKNAIEAYNNGE
jgi:uncharacterized membrane protein YoaK (UPF0700 family)